MEENGSRSIKMIAREEFASLAAGPGRRLNLSAHEIERAEAE